MILNVKLIRMMLFLILIVAAFTAGCVIQDPQALTDLSKANSAIASAEEKGAKERFPDEFAALESRYLEARGTFYACKEDAASEMARALVADANALAEKRVEAPMPPMPSNKPPVARFSGPLAGNINSLLTFNAADSSDPDGDKLTYKWDFGDGTMSTYTFPVATHRFARIGNYTVMLTVDDGRGGMDSTSANIKVSSMQVIQSDVLFHHDKYNLKPTAREKLDKIVGHLMANPKQTVHVVGHTDSSGTDAYNMKLSERRANSVRDYFIANGVAANRISIAWKGESEPIATNKTKEGRAQNRRAEITINPAMQ